MSPALKQQVFIFRKPNMQLSAKRLNPELKKELTRTLNQLIADLKTPEEVEEFLNAFLSTAEKLALIKRVGIAYYLAKGRGYENIKTNLKVSSATIAAIQNLLGKQKGVELTLKKIDADKWAIEWSQKIQKLFKKPVSLLLSSLS